MSRLLLIVAGLFLFTLACKAPSAFVAEGNKNLVRTWSSLDIARTHHTGLSIFDPVKKKWIFRYKGDNFFTPASNTKILTLYTALQTLPDTLEAAWYAIRGDSLVIWGGGDPGMLYPDIDSSAALLDFLSACGKIISFSNSHFHAKRFGTGWAWDDYHYPYQCERNAFPIYGNRMWIQRDHDHISVTPAYLGPLLRVTADGHFHTGKSEWGDQYYYSYRPMEPSGHAEIPITYFKNDLLTSWSEAIGNAVHFSFLPFSAMTDSVKGSVRDTLLKTMMQESDNFIAEQLLLACALKKLRIMSDDSIIQYMMHGPLHDESAGLKWFDGSGLSRYNLMTPDALISVLLKIYELKGMDYIRHIFPAGGQSGTIKDWYRGPGGRPYIFAKTGTLRYNHCLSGFLVTRSGKVLIFSWMHNQFSGGSDTVKKEMERYFTFLYDHY